MNISALAGKPAPVGMRVDAPRLVSARCAEAPDPAVPAERVAFGTSGHRGPSFYRLSLEAMHAIPDSQFMRPKSKS